MLANCALTKQHVKLDDVVDRALEIAAPLIQSRQHKLVVQRTGHNLWLIADLVRLTQVLVNLLSNAAKYTPTGGEIRLVVEKNQSNAVVRIHDNGIGISPELLPHIFDFFVQAETGTTRANGGLGIGLAVCFAARRTARRQHRGHQPWIEPRQRIHRPTAAGTDVGTAASHCVGGRHIGLQTEHL